MGDLTQALQRPHWPEVAVRERDLHQPHDDQGDVTQLDQGDRHHVVIQDQEGFGGKLINIYSQIFQFLFLCEHAVFEESESYDVVKMSAALSTRLVS